MPCIKYEHKNFRPAALAIIHAANRIISEYQEQGYDLTLRQLYYQFVSRDWLANDQREYKRLGKIISGARRAGLIDWNAIVDRTRNLETWQTWDSPSAAIARLARSYAIDLWADQDVYVEIWYEKDALMGVFERASQEYTVPYFSCRGFASDSELWAAGQRMADKALDEGKRVIVLHFGDHDPSGIDMTRDIEERLAMFSESADIEVRRLALNFDQIEQYNPPPNPGKETDTRFASYARKFGNESWELDALEPQILASLVKTEIERVINIKKWNKSVKQEEKERKAMVSIATNYDDIKEFLAGNNRES